MTKDTQTQAIIYCRVSSAKQKKEGHGLESQEIRCREYAGFKGYDVRAAFHDDFTGAAVNRPGMKQLVAFLKKCTTPGTVVIIDDISRLARSVRTHFSLRDAIALAGGVLESPNTIFADDADSEVQEIIQAAFSGYHRRKNAEQVKHRMRARLMAGYWVFQAPVGYRYEKVEGHGKLLCRHEPFASIIQRALEGFASGRFQTPTEVARFIQADPHWAKSSRPKLNQRHAKDVLTNLVYTSHIDHPDWDLRMLPAKHEALISFETHQKIQDRLKGVAYAPARKDINRDFALRGFVACASCGKPLYGCWSKGRSASYPYYLCVKKGCADYGKSIRRDVVEQQFTTLLGDMRPSYPLLAVVRDAFGKMWNARAEQAKAEAASIKSEIVEVDRNVAQLVDRIVATSVPTLIAAYEDRIGELEKRKVLLRERMEQTGKPPCDFDTGFRTAIAFLANPQKLWLSGVFELQRLVLKLAFDGRAEYARNQGFRTAPTALPFTLLSREGQSTVRMVDQ